MDEMCFWSSWHPVSSSDEGEVRSDARRIISSNFPLVREFVQRFSVFFNKLCFKLGFYIDIVSLFFFFYQNHAFSPTCVFRLWLFLARTVRVSELSPDASVFCCITSICSVGCSITGSSLWQVQAHEKTASSTSLVLYLFHPSEHQRDTNELLW